MPVRDENEDFATTRRRETLAIQAGLTVEDTLHRLDKIEQVHSVLNRGGIKRISWTYEYANKSIDESTPWPRHLDVELIETQDGETLFRTPTPSVWPYLLIALFPTLGFFIPWSLVRASAWVQAGFSES